MTEFARRADGDAASSEKCADNPSAVNWRPIGAVAAELIRRLAENRAGNFPSYGSWCARRIQTTSPTERRHGRR
jgi:hypothetical protein